MPYPAAVVANEFLKLSDAQGKTLTPMKVQKLVYFAHGWCLALTERPLIRERVEAWQYGPVIPSIYHEFKEAGNGPITSPATDLVNQGGKLMFKAPSLDDYPDDEERRNAREIIGRVFALYGKYSAIQLSNATHASNTPWQKAYREGERKITISNDAIKTYFQGLANAPAR